MKILWHQASLLQLCLVVLCLTFELLPVEAFLIDPMLAIKTTRRWTDSTTRIRIRNTRNHKNTAATDKDILETRSIIPRSQVPQQPFYSMSGIDLSQRWIDLVQQNQVQATVTLPLPKSSTADASDLENNNTTAVCQYGIHLVPISDNSKGNDSSDDTADSTTTTLWKYQEFVQQLDRDQEEETNNRIHPRIREIQQALQSNNHNPHHKAPQQESPTSSSVMMSSRHDGPFVAQLQLLRTLRPPPSAGFATATTSVPPPYDSSTDSFVTGPLKLTNRPKTATLHLPTNKEDQELTTPWDVYHNISPADTRGHLLLIPSLDDEDDDSASQNWRGQVLTTSDCHDIIHLVASIEPVGSLFVGFNSVGAAASQNHIHCHAWPIPSQSPYAVTQTNAIRDFCDVGHVEVSWLAYPVMCVQLSTTTTTEHLAELATVLEIVLESIGDAPYNLGFLNRVVEDDDDGDGEDESDNSNTPATAVDVYLFVRSKERSSVCPALKLGISEMMGVFHAQSQEELEFWGGTSKVAMETSNAKEENGKTQIYEEAEEDHDDDHDHELKCDGPMGQALEDVSYENEMEMWETICEKLYTMESTGKL